MNIRFHSDTIGFLDYPYAPATVYTSGKIAYADIREIDSDAAPPEVRTATGETLFIPATMKEDLRRAACNHGISEVKRIDVWALILEPFLDTEFTEDQKERTLRVLEESGVSPDESIEIRRFVAEAMEAYNFRSGLWDWCDLGLMDALNALRGILSGISLAPDDYEAFYWRAMELAGRGKILG
jgi:hypothetical protein